jgi:hypothetical protein
MYPFAYFLGPTLVSCGVIILAAKRRHKTLAVLTVVAALTGGSLGLSVWEANHPGFQFSKSTTDEERHELSNCGTLGSILGGVTVLVAAAMASVFRKRSD